MIRLEINETERDKLQQERQTHPTLGLDAEWKPSI